MNHFEMKRAESGGLPVLRLKGKLTLGEGARALRGRISDISAEGHKFLLLDLGEISYVDSSGLGTLVAGYNSLRANGGAMGLFRVPARVQDLLEMGRLTTIFRIFG